jgi:hypothetical protein
MAEFVSQDDRKAFEDWLKRQAIDRATSTPEDLPAWRRLFEESRQHRAAAENVGLAKRRSFLHFAWPRNAPQRLSENLRGRLPSKLRHLADVMGSAFGVALVMGSLTSIVAFGTAAAIFVTGCNMGRHMHVGLSHPERQTNLQAAAGERPIQPGRIEPVNAAPLMIRDASCRESCVLEPNEAEKAQLATKKGLQEQIRLVIAGRQWLLKQAGYTATFVKRERVQDVLNPAEEMRMVLRHVPFAVRLDWVESGQRVAYVDGENGNMLLVRLGGAKRLFGTLKIDPNGECAMQNTRHPISEIGLQNMADRVCGECQGALKEASGVTFEGMPDELVAGRTCAVYVIEYLSPKFNSDFRTVRFWTDREWGVPLRFQATGWCEPANDQPVGGDGLIEFYEYRDVAFLNCVNPADFNVSTKLVDRGSR